MNGAAALTSREIDKAQDVVAQVQEAARRLNGWLEEAHVRGIDLDLDVQRVVQIGVPGERLLVGVTNCRLTVQLVTPAALTDAGPEARRQPAYTEFAPDHMLLRYQDWERLVLEVRPSLNPEEAGWLADWEAYDLQQSPFASDEIRRQRRLGHYMGWLACRRRVERGR